jgi:gamma-glutamyl hercynylcysteine S-oxide synthase
MARPMAALETDSLEKAREQTLALVDGVADHDLERVHSPLMSPLVWDLGHIAAFEDLWLAHRLGGLALVRPDLMHVYDAFETPRAGRGDLPFLRRAGAEQYLATVRERVRSLSLAADETLVALVLRHERQHAETMLQTLALAGLEGWRPPIHGVPLAFEGAPQSGLELIEVATARVPIGAGPDGFAYDNERPQHEVEVESFAIGRVPVTNGDWRAFVEDGGYQRAQWWSDEGWAWRIKEQVELPLRWLDGASERRLDGVHPIDPRTPVVHVSFHEAEAFAQSRGVRLPTEWEWEVAATWDPALGIRRTWPWGEQAPEPRYANLIESGAFAPLAAGALSDGASPCGALGMLGDVWEWTSSEFRGYPGFVAYPYREYSEVFFGGDYRVLRGGAFASSADVVTPPFRNWDYPSRRQIFSGVRVASDTR